MNNIPYEDIRTLIKLSYNYGSAIEEDAGQHVQAWLDSQPEQPAMPMPDWSTAPEWAQWWAVDADGTIGWYRDAPIAHDETLMWTNSVHRIVGWVSAGRCTLSGDTNWRTTLQRRPKEEEE